MTRTAVYSRQAERDLRGLERTAAQRILRAIRNYSEAGVGDVRILRGHRYGFRLRVGIWRVLFDSDQTTGTIRIRRVLHRREAYRDR